MKEKTSFLIYYDWESLFDSLNSDEEAGELIKALFAFAKRGEIQEFTGALKMAFAFMSQQIARDSQKYIDKCKKNTGNINKRWNTNDTNVYERIRTYTNDTDTDTDTDTDNDTDKKEIKKEKGTKLDSIILEYTDNEQLQTALKDYIKLRKALKSPLTDRALQLAVNKLDKLADTDERKIAVVEQSIERGWKGLFPLKEEPKEEKKDGFDASKYEFLINNF